MIKVPIKMLNKHSKSDIRQLKSDKEYLKNLQRTLKEDLLNSAKVFNNEHENLKRRLHNNDYTHIDDQYLIKKCTEAIDNSSKLYKKLAKYREIGDIKCSTFKEMYNTYSLISEIAKNTSIIRGYNTQIIKYSKFE